MLPRPALALSFALLAVPVLAQPAPFTVCLVQTKPTASIQYEPSAGPWAVQMDKLLTTQKLRNGTPLKITVLAASTDKEVLPEVQRLHCPWVIQLWYHRDSDLATFSQQAPDRYESDLPESERVQPNFDEDSLLFSLWNGSTQRVIARGATPIRLLHRYDRLPPNPLVADPIPCTALTQQIMRRLNKLH